MREISKYVAAKNKIASTPYVIKPSGECYFLVEGKEVHEDKFLAQFGNALEMIKPNIKGSNPDKRKNWMGNEKSY